MEKIPFNKKYKSGEDLNFLKDLLENTNLETEKKYTNMAMGLLQTLFGYKNIFLTHSSTGALEIIALALSLKPTDEIILPSYTYVSTATAFARQNAKLIFADTKPDVPLISEEHCLKLSTQKTRAIVPVHYGGLSCNMEALMRISESSGSVIIEDAAHALGSYCNSKPLGSIGHFGVISFHDTKNIYAGKGGALIVNDETFLSRIRKIYDNGTNRYNFLEKKAKSYEWVDLGSSFEISEFNAAILSAQLLEYNKIDKKRTAVWNRYRKELDYLKEKLILPPVTSEYSHNSHIFYLCTKTNKERNALIQHLNEHGIDSRFHFQSLHKSEFYRKIENISLANTEKFSDCLLRLPIFPELIESQQTIIINRIKEFYSR